jgi:peptide chain release factor 3
LDPQTKREIERRRTFAIISHPDAGKTTMTEKLLLYGGAIHEAGEVKAKKDRRMARSDWMKLEQERGISVSTSVMQFDYSGLRLNLLDTPGHADFSEDTYRTLAAVDSALMLLDNAKGVEVQTKKLFEVCRLRNTPIFTFINKLDREGRSPFELMEEIEQTLQIQCNPVTWPISCGDRFRGIYHRLEKKFILYTSQGFATQEAREFSVDSLSDPRVLEVISERERDELASDIELVDGTLGPPNKEDFLAGIETPVMFGSARTAFGVKPFLDLFASVAPPPGPVAAVEGQVNPTDSDFAGFVFKIQANMDKKHRDRVAFVRIVSGKFNRGMTVNHARLGKELRLSYSQQFFANERKSIEEAYAGDILGLHDTGNCLLGDTLYAGNKKVRFRGIPLFSPEHFSRVLLKDPLKRKQLQKGITQLCEEGTIQYFVIPSVGDQEPILGAVGMLQFEVLVYRLRDEYGVEVALTPQPYRMARWIKPKDRTQLMPEIDGSLLLVQDRLANPVALFTSDFNLSWVVDNNPKVEFSNTMIID